MNRLVKNQSRRRVRSLRSIVIPLMLLGVGSASIATALAGNNDQPVGRTIVDQRGAVHVVGRNDIPPAPPPGGPVAPLSGPAADTVQVHMMRNGKMYTVDAHVKHVETVDRQGRPTIRNEVSIEEVNSQLPPMETCGPTPTPGCWPADRPRTQR